jgi:protein translocase SecG subunit
MFIISLLTSLFAFLCLLIIFMVLLQRGKSSMGLGNMGGGNQMLFGSSGGQDVFQKITWVMCILLLSGSLAIAVLKAKYRGSSISYTKEMPVATQTEDIAEDSSDDTEA